MIIKRATVEDAGFIRDVYGYPDIWDEITDDGIESIDTINIEQALTQPHLYFFTPFHTGVFFFHPWNTITYEMHSAVLPEYRGNQALEGATLSACWMFANTPCRKIVTLIRKGNYRARALAHKGGMVQEGMLNKSFLRHGKAHDQYIYAVCKEDM